MLAFCCGISSLGSGADKMVSYFSLEPGLDELRSQLAISVIAFRKERSYGRGLVFA